MFPRKLLGCGAVLLYSPSLLSAPSVLSPLSLGAGAINFNAKFRTFSRQTASPLPLHFGHGKNVIYMSEGKSVAYLLLLMVGFLSV